MTARAAAGSGETPGNRLFNAHHAPVGAYAIFTLGHPGASGGFGIEQPVPVGQDVLIGVERDGVAAFAPDAVGYDFRLASDAFSVRQGGSPAPRVPVLPGASRSSTAPPSAANTPRAA